MFSLLHTSSCQLEFASRKGLHFVEQVWRRGLLWPSMGVARVVVEGGSPRGVTDYNGEGVCPDPAVYLGQSTAEC